MNSRAYGRVASQTLVKYNDTFVGIRNSNHNFLTDDNDSLVIPALREH